MRNKLETTGRGDADPFFMYAERQSLQAVPDRRMNRGKRIFDVVVAGAALLVTLPVFVLAGLAIKLDSPGPIFFRGVRAGRNGRPFRVYKFRTMVVGAASSGVGITTRDDPRVTRVGKFLRRTKLDELPQLLNVVIGKMSLVGPRPEDPRYLQYYTLPQRVVLSVPPGITGAASIAFRHEEALLHGVDWERTYISEILPKKLQLELDYLSRRTLLSDMGLIVRTVRVLFKRESPRHVT